MKYLPNYSNNPFANIYNHVGLAFSYCSYHQGLVEFMVDYYKHV